MLMKIIYSYFFTLLFALLFNANNTSANHLIGTDISYQCTTTPGIYLVTARIYRDCSNSQFCPNCPTGLSPTCGIQFSVSGAISSSIIPSSPCSGVGFGAITLNVNTSVSGFDIVQLCNIGKTVCTNCGSRTPGTFSPGIEVYQFSGNVNLTTIPSSCCFIELSYQTCCRPYGISTIANSGDVVFFANAIINRCASPCNNAPTFYSNPTLIGCSGQDFYYNIGAVDPDGDSLSYALVDAKTSIYNSVPYLTPYNGQNPAVPPGLPPNGTFFDPINGTIRFKPIGSYAAPIVVEVRQWRNIANVPTLMGVTARDMLFYSQVCTPNNTPDLKVYNKDGSNIIQPLYFNHGVCAGNELCFIVVATDKDSLSDSTNLAWNAPANLVSKGATFTRLYDSTTRQINGPRQDSMLFCWTPSLTDTFATPLYFLVTAKDNVCPLPGKKIQAFSITVKNTPKVAITKVSKPCSFYEFGYTLLNNASINPYGTKFFIEKEPHSNQFITYQTNDVFSHGFRQSGWHKVGLQVATYAPPMPDGCFKLVWDSVFVGNSVKVSIVDTTFCGNKSILVQAKGRSGVPFGNSYKYTFYKGGFGSKQIIKAQSTDSTCLITPPYLDDTNVFFVRIVDQLGCTDSAEFNLIFRSEPMRELPLKALFCYGKVDTINAGNNSETVNQWVWKKLDGSAFNNDSLSQKIVPNSSGFYMVEKVNQYSCKSTDTIEVIILPEQQVHITALYQHPICESESNTLTFAGEAKMLYQWYKNNQLLNWGNSSFYQATKTGDYHLVVTDSNNCSKASNVVSVLANPLPINQVITGEIFPIADSPYFYSVPRQSNCQYQWLELNSPLQTIWGAKDSNVIKLSWVSPPLGLATVHLSLEITNEYGCKLRINEIEIHLTSSSPIINYFAPTSSNRFGEVHIYGQFFNSFEPQKVRFGGVDAAAFQVISGSHIMAIVDTGASGAVEVETSIGTASKNGFTYLSTGLSSLLGARIIQMYPNPTQSKVNLDFGNIPLRELKEIRVINALGQTVLLQTIDKAQVSLDLSKFADQSFYFIEVLNQNAERIFLKKLIIIK
jgi:hypothetical protein